MIRVEIKDKKAAQVTVVCLLFALVGIAIFLCMKLVQWKDYVWVDATVEGIYTAEGTLARPNDRHTEVAYSFKINGQDYWATRNEWFQGQRHVGEARMIRYNPNDPEMLEDVWARSGLIVILCGGTVILLFLLLGLWQEHKVRKV